MDHRSLILFASVIAFAVAGTSARAEDGVTKDRIVFGQVAALEGPAQALGQGMRQGLLAAFAEVNRAGGVAGRQLELKSADDSYEPQKTIEAMKKLLAEEKVFAIVGAAGQPIATEAKVPFIGPFTGAEFLRTPYKRYVVNIRTSYFQETQAWIEHLTRDLGFSQIAILYQDDSFGRSGLEGVKRALEKRGLALVAEGTYMRGTTAVKRALLAIRRGHPQAVVMVGAYKPCAEFIKLARKIKLDAVFVNISFVGSEPLAEELRGEGAGVVVTQVVPLPNNTKIPLVARYQKALMSVNPSGKPGFVSLEGYVVGRLVVEALNRSENPLTRAGFLATIKNVGVFELDGITLSYGPASNQGMDDVYLTVIQPDGSFKTVERLSNADVRWPEPRAGVDAPQARLAK